MLESALKAAVKRLHGAKKSGLLDNFCLIGGLAVSGWSQPRATMDIDFLVQIPRGAHEQLATAVSGVYRRGDISDALMGTISFIQKAGRTPVPIQLIELPPSWEREVVAGIITRSIGGVKVPLINWRELVLIKLYAGGPLDLEDARSILANVKPSKSEYTRLMERATALRVSRKLAKVFRE